MPNRHSAWPVVRLAVGMVERGDTGPSRMIDALLFGAVYFAFRTGMDRRQLLHRLLGKWAEMELADGRAVWIRAAES